MPIVIREIVTEVIIRGPEDTDGDAVPTGATLQEPDPDAAADALVARAVERVMEILRREWER